MGMVGECQCCATSIEPVKTQVIQLFANAATSHEAFIAHTSCSACLPSLLLYRQIPCLLPFPVSAYLIFFPFPAFAPLFPICKGWPAIAPPPPLHPSHPSHSPLLPWMATYPCTLPTTCFMQSLPPVTPALPFHPSQHRQRPAQQITSCLLQPSAYICSLSAVLRELQPASVSSP